MKYFIIKALDGRRVPKIRFGTDLVLNCFKLINRDPMEEIMQAYSAASAYYRPPARALVYSNFGRDEQLSQGK